MRITKVDLIILGVCVLPSAYLTAVAIKLTWKTRKTEKAGKKDAAIELESLVYAAEKVSKRLKAGRYPDGKIQEFLTDMRFYQLTRAEELRNKFKDV